MTRHVSSSTCNDDASTSDVDAFAALRGTDAVVVVVVEPVAKLAFVVVVAVVVEAVVVVVVAPKFADSKHFPAQPIKKDQ